MTSFDQSQSSSGGGRGLRDALLFSLVMLAIGGIAIMDLKESWGFWYWIAMVPIFGGLSVYLEWNTQVHAANPKPLHLKAQLVHWLATLLGVGLVFLMEDRRIEFDRTETGLMSLLVLGLSTVLLGVHTQWRLAVVGLLLLVTLVAAMAAEQFFWLMLIPTAIALWVMHRRQK